jgi:hypothetical protein
MRRTGRARGQGWHCIAECWPGEMFLQARVHQPQGSMPHLATLQEARRWRDLLCQPLYNGSQQCRKASAAFPCCCPHRCTCAAACLPPGPLCFQCCLHCSVCPCRCCHPGCQAAIQQQPAAAGLPNRTGAAACGASRQRCRLKPERKQAAAERRLQHTRGGVECRGCGCKHCGQVGRRWIN